MTTTLVDAATPDTTCSICQRTRTGALRLLDNGELQPTGALHCDHCDRHCTGCPTCQTMWDNIQTLSQPG